MPNASSREIAAWCLPALALGLGLRVLLLIYMPMAFISPDTNEFFGSKLIGGSRTFLPKLIYQAFGHLGLPLLPSIAVFQHLLGAGLILACGFVCAQWLQKWRWWIVPYTCLIAVHPTLLWYEHFALPDSTFTLLVVLVFLAGTRFYQRPTPLNFGILFGLLLLTAGARQEGFLLSAFGVALVVRAYWGHAARLRLFAPLAVGLAAGIFLVSRTNQGGFMMLTSLIQWAPDQLHSEPGLSERVVKLRNQFKPQWVAYPDQHNRSRKIIFADIEDYFRKERGIPEKQVSEKAKTACQKMAFEIAVQSLWRLPRLVFNKFRASHSEDAAPDFGPEWAHAKHLNIFFGRSEDYVPKEHKMMGFYLGREYASREDLQSALPHLYRILPGDFLSVFQRWFYAAEYGMKVVPTERVGTQTLPGLSLFYFLSAAGFLLVIFREGRSLSEKQMWVLMLLFQAFVIFLTGSLRSRYRLSFEPWFFLGLFALFDGLVAWRKLPHRIPGPGIKPEEDQPLENVPQ